MHRRYGPCAKVCVRGRRTLDLVFEVLAFFANRVKLALCCEHVEREVVALAEQSASVVRRCSFGRILFLLRRRALELGDDRKRALGTG